MLAANIPAKFPLPFAKNAGGSYIRTVPTASQIGVVDGAASLNDGFPPLNFTPISGGGVPPFGQDFNGILFQSTSWDQWFSAGGPVTFDAAFAAQINGYPAGAVVQATGQLGSFWLNLVDNNSANPDTGGGNWVGFTPISLFAVDSGSANALVITLSPPPINQAALTGRALRVQKGAAANNAAVTLDVNSFGPQAVVHADGTALAASELPASGILSVVWDGANYQLQSASALTVTPSQLQIQAGNAAVDTGTANLVTITLSPVPTSQAALDKVPIRIKKVNAANNANVVVNVNSLGGQSLKHADGSQMQVGELPANGLFEIAWDNTGSTYVLLSPPLAPGVASSVAQTEAGTDLTTFLTPGRAKYHDSMIKGWAIFHWNGASIVSTKLSATVQSISRNSQGNYTIQMQGGLNFDWGFAFVNGRGGGTPGTGGAIGMGSSFQGTDPSFHVYFGDAGGSGGESSDPLADVGVLIIGHTLN